MTKALTTLTFIAVAGTAMAHPGHVEHAAGHDHFGLLTGIGLIALAIAAPFVARAVRKLKS